MSFGSMVFPPCVSQADLRPCEAFDCVAVVHDGKSVNLIALLDNRHPFRRIREPAAAINESAEETPARLPPQSNEELDNSKGIHQVDVYRSIDNIGVSRPMFSPIYTTHSGRKLCPP